MSRNVTIIPGSSSWWILTLTPILFYDNIIVSDNDIKDVYAQAGNSSLHDRTTEILDSLLNYDEEPIVIRNSTMPPLGRTNELKIESERITSMMLSLAENHRPSRPTLIRPSDIKRALTTAYNIWIKYNKRKLILLNKDESLAITLRKEKIPKDLESLNIIKNTSVYELPNLLDFNKELRKVLEELVRNSILITNLADSEPYIVYDYLIDEFIPTIEIVEKIRVYNDLLSEIDKPQDINILSNLYEYRIKRINENTSNTPSTFDAFKLAIKGRKQLSELRNKIKALDITIKEGDVKKESFKKDVQLLTKEIDNAIDRIERVGVWGVWLSAASTSYFVAEMISSLSYEAQLLAKSLVFNPFTAKKINELFKNYTLVKKGVKPSWNGRISLIRDFIVPKYKTSRKNYYTSTPKNMFKFWV